MKVKVCLVLGLATLMVYGQAATHEFITLDDGVYVTQNPYVQRGLTLESVGWAFRFKNRDFITYNYWQPLTWLSHMLDCHWFGLKSGMHHLGSVIIHIVNSLLLFIVFNRMTGALWRSAFVAALFALHPVNVESVAWVAERKNVLSTFFWLLTMLAYLRYVQRPDIIRYLTIIFVFMLGLMAKPMLVTLPFVLILMDYWPLRRLPPGRLLASGGDNALEEKASGLQGIYQLIVEKIPLFALSGVSIYLSTFSVQDYGSLKSTALVSMDLRIANALVSYVKYIFKAAWPQNLSVYYPFPEKIPEWQVAGAVLVLAAVSVLAVRLMKKRPYFMTGWLWYLGTLVPVIGFVQAGLWPEMADRWAYVPFIGVFVIVVWGVPDLIERWRYRKVCLGVAGAMVLMILSMLTYWQNQYWQNSAALFRHSLDVSNNNVLIHCNLANVLMDKGRTEDAIRHYEMALQLKPDFSEAHNNLGVALNHQGKTEQAVEHFHEALRIHPSYSEAHRNLGVALSQLGKIDEAIGHYTSSLSMDPGNAELHNNLGLALLRQGKVDQAVFHFQKASSQDHNGRSADHNLRRALALQKKIDKAVQNLKGALAVKPESSHIGVSITRIIEKRKALEQVEAQYRKALAPQPGFTPDELKMENYSKVAEVKYALRVVLPLFEKLSRLERDNAVFKYYVSCVYSLRNQQKDSIHWLDLALKAGFKDFRLIRRDPNLDNIRDTLYYQENIEDR